ncbi:MAG: tRNA 4-thiouridine(8) synthase ThiI [Acidobacteriota bacterium]
MKLRQPISPKPKKEDVVRAILLLSGGLDSILAGLLLQQQGIDILPLSFESPFFSADKAEEAARKQDWPLLVADITKEEIEVIKNPQHGYGKNMNPCLDCHALMVRQAGSLLSHYEADFVATGEVLGERPKSQNFKALRLVEKESGMEGLLLRPLSAKLLPETEVEKKGLVDRQKLLDIKGRSRKRQLDLASTYGLKDYPTPSGGCLLTDPGFSNRLKKLMEWRREPRVEDIRLLKLGRHFFFKNHCIIVGRTKEENEVLKKRSLPSDVQISTESKPGPTTLIRTLNKKPEETVLREAALITIRYSQARYDPEVKVLIKNKVREHRMNLPHDEWEKYFKYLKETASAPSCRVIDELSG